MNEALFSLGVLVAGFFCGWACITMVAVVLEPFIERRRRERELRRLRAESLLRQI